jgi:hypothetical protein
MHSALSGHTVWSGQVIISIIKILNLVILFLAFYVPFVQACLGFLQLLDLRKVSVLEQSFVLYKSSSNNKFLSGRFEFTSFLRIYLR